MTQEVKPLQPRAILEWGVVQSPIEDSEICGDAYFVKEMGDRCLVAVVDGLGHGKEAAAASAKAVQTLEAYASEHLIVLIQRCNEALQETRGVVMSLAEFDSSRSTLLWAGVGNVEGVLLRRDRRANPSRERIISRAGIVGYQVPPVHASLLLVAPGDMLVLASDGIFGGFTEEITDVYSDVQKIAHRILAQYGNTKKDDALVLVARYLGRI